MDYEFIKQRIAPCGLHCGKCFAFSEGDISNHSRKLRDSLGNFDAYAQRFVSLLEEPVFNNYPQFKELLSYFASVGCRGCRIDNCKLFKDCRVRECHVKNEVDFCFECSKFPCNETGFDEHLYKRFVDINNKLKEKGVSNYYDEVKDKPRY